MSTARRLATVLRVAALQETVARAAAGRATAEVLRAEAEQAVAEDALRARPLTSAGSAGFAGAAQARALGASVASAAAAQVQEAEGARDGAVGGWTAARGRVRLLEELDARERTAAAAVREGAAQRLADDLSAARAARLAGVPS